MTLLNFIGIVIGGFFGIVFTVIIISKLSR